jgi:bacterioferritin-associated ferredoxin
VLVCHCKKICDRTIAEAIRAGARSVEDVGQACGAGTACGGCRPAISALVAPPARRDPPLLALLSSPLPSPA